MGTLSAYEGPVRFEPQHNTDEGVRTDNIRATFERGYVSFNELLSTVTEGAMSIVGSGPSLSLTYKEIVGDIMACNSAHDFLIGKGVIPKYALYWDANPITAKYAQHPHPDVTYLVASRCHPSVFEALKGYRVIVFHALSGEPVEQFLIEHNKMEPLVGGGSAGVTRGVYLAGAIGYMDLHLFGADSSYAEDATHVSASLIEQKKMRLRVCGKWFITAPWMALQVADFKIVVPHLQNIGVKFTIHGTGMFPYAASFLSGVETPDIKIGMVERLRRWASSLIVLYLGLRGDNRYAEMNT